METVVKERRSERATDALMLDYRRMTCMTKTCLLGCQERVQTLVVVYLCFNPCFNNFVHMPITAMLPFMVWQSFSRL